MDVKKIKEKIREPKVTRIFLNVCDFQKETTLGTDFKSIA